ncbi:hypothetical protein E2320_015910, partial [Naja naja]
PCGVNSCVLEAEVSLAQGGREGGQSEDPGGLSKVSCHTIDSFFKQHHFLHLALLCCPLNIVHMRLATLPQNRPFVFGFKKQTVT